MSDLIERLEKLTGPCRECDCLIALEGGWDLPHHVAPLPALHKKFGLEWLVQAATKYNSTYNVLPAYTASIDASMTLVPEGLPWSLNYPANDDGSRSCHGIPTKPTADVCGILGHAATPAIALCIAALKAKDLP